MEERVAAEIVLLKSVFPKLEIRDDLWCRFPRYRLPGGIWTARFVQLAFQIPPGLPGMQPYAFWVHPSIQLTSGATVGNYSAGVTTGFGAEWGQFSWAPEVWTPAADVAEITKGTNMVNFVESFAVRLSEAS